jgi:hypothetical protein
MANITAFFGILLVLGIVFPGLLTTWWLLFPATVERARIRLDRTPWPCFWLGGVLTAIFAIPTVTLLALPFGPAKLAGFALIVVALAVASLGEAGLAAKMGERLAARADGRHTPAGAFLRGAVALELAAAFPIIGWLIVVPLAVVTALGATAFALLRWMPRTVERVAADTAAISQA